MAYIDRWHFNHPPREEQKQILDFVETSKSIVLAVDAPTGVGKSPICVTLGTADGGNILTTQRILQDQYQRDWPHVPLLKGAANYICPDMMEEKGDNISCEVGIRRHRCEVCPYQQARMALRNARCGITNYAYAMAGRRSGDNSAMVRKKWLILDEAHHCENALINAAEVVVFGNLCVTLGVIYQEPQDTEQAIGFAVRLADSARIKLEELKRTSAHSKMSLNDCKLSRELENIISSVDTMQDDMDGEWVFQVMEKRNGFTIKPLQADGLFTKFILPFGERVFMTSATLLGGELMAKWLGIAPENFSFMSVDSPFPVDNRPVWYKPVAPMDYNNYRSSLPKIARAIEKIINSSAYKDQKGIIHTSSFKLSMDLADLLKNRRILAHTSENRDEVLAKHIVSEEPTILMSPSMYEGVDLKDDLSRFTIFPKIPYPSISDVWTKLRMKRDYRWYQWQTMKNVIQGVGRSVRSPEDYAEAYILDSCWDGFWGSAKSLSPKWFKKSIA